ncbi:MAG: hypothetical protein U1E61_07410 [Bradyrhizobium sp.]
MPAWAAIPRKNLHFQPRQVLAEADMDTMPESQVAAMVPVDAEAIRRVEGPLVPVSRNIAQHQPIVPGNPPSIQHDLL